MCCLTLLPKLLALNSITDNCLYRQSYVPIERRICSKKSSYYIPALSTKVFRVS